MSTPLGIPAAFCILRDHCGKWHHLKCTDLSKSQLEIFTCDKAFEWVCDQCLTDKCQKCNIPTKERTKIQCEKCNKKFHLRCAGLSKTAYIPTTSWYCYQCHGDVFPLNTISVNQLLNLSFSSRNFDKHPNQLKTVHNSTSSDSMNGNLSLEQEAHSQIFG